MPKQTFYNLKEEKREKIEQALLKEFSNNTFEGASISNIIAEAQIPRGSFYQYFENKDDAVEYIINKYLKKEKEKIYTSLLRNNGDIFKTSIDIYDYIIEKINTTSNLKLFKNILQELRKNNTNAFEENTEFLSGKKTIEKIIDKRDLNIQEKEDLCYFLKILSLVMRNATLEVISNKITQEEGKQKLLKEIEILKRGMKK